MKRKLLIVLLSMVLVLPLLNSRGNAFAVPQSDNVLILRQEDIAPMPIDYGEEDQFLTHARQPHDIVSAVVYIEGQTNLETENRAVLNRARDLRSFLTHQITALGGVVNFEYATLFSGLGIEIEYRHLGTIYNLPYVVAVSSVYFEPLMLDNDGDNGDGDNGDGGYENGDEDDEDDDGRTPNLRNFDNTNIILTNNGIYDLSSVSHQGQGMLVAIIDSGVSPNHSVFQIDPPGRRYTDTSFITPALMGQLHATRNISQAHISTLFRSQKVPFAFDYAHNRAGAFTPQISNHGTHVAGIAAGHSNTFRGAAPYAQIAAMKVQSDGGGGIPMSAVYAAMEDAVLIGADVINVSVGASSGFSSSNIGDIIIARAIEKGINFYFSAGNSFFSGHYSYAGGAFASNPDTGLIASPSSLIGVMSVANAARSGGGFAPSSAMGPTPDLRLKPDITGPGLNIRSAWGQGQNTFNTTSGTSMSSPNVAGGAAALLQSMRSQSRFEDLSNQEMAILMNRILMSTARALINIEDIPFTPRRQGAGYADIISAMSVKSIAYAYPNGPSKIGLGHDPDKTGIFNMQFVMQNLTNYDRTYDLRLSVQTAGYSYGEGGYMIEMRPMFLSSSYSISVGNQSGIDRVVVPAQGSIIVGARIELSDEDRDLIRIFENGMFVEGFIFADSVYAENGDTRDISIPYLGFFGDWTKAPVFDALSYDRDRLPQSMSADNLGLVASFNYGAPVQLMGAYASRDMTPDFFAMQPAYIQERLLPNREYIAIGYRDAHNHAMSIQGLRAGTLRNMVDFYAELVDPVFGDQIFSNHIAGDPLNVQKSYNRDAPGGAAHPFQLYVGAVPWLIRNNNIPLNSNTRLDLNFRGALDFGGREHKTLESLPVYIDFEAPIVLNAQTSSIGGNLYLDVEVVDNHFARVIRLYRREGGALISLSNYGTPIVSFYRGAATKTRVHISQDMIDELGGSRLYVYIEDFARNGITYSIENLQNATMSSKIIQNNFDKTLDNDICLDYNIECSILCTRKNCLTGELLASTKRVSMQDIRCARRALLLSTPPKRATPAPFSADFAHNGGIYRPLAGGGYMLMGADNNNLTPILRIKQGTKRINQQAFLNAAHLTEVIFPKSVQRIGSDAFRGARNLFSFTFEGDTPPLLEVLYARYTNPASSPYWHFNNRFDFHRDNMPGLREMTLRTQEGVQFNNWVYTTYFDNRVIDNRRIRFLIGDDVVAEFFGNSFDRLGAQSVPSDPTGERPFWGWSINGEIVDLGEGIYFNDFDFLAEFEPTHHTVTLRRGNIVIDTMQIERGAVFNIEDIEDYEPTLAGHEFLGWYLDNGFNTPFLYKEVLINFNLYARFALLPPTHYTVTLIVGGEEWGTMTIDRGARLEIVQIERPYRSGYAFLGWYLDDEFLDAFSGQEVHGDFSLYARHETVAPPARFRVTLVTLPNMGIENDGIEIEYVYEGDAFDPGVLSRPGYKFLGWYRDSGFRNSFETGSEVTSDLRLYARWQREGGCGACGAISWGDVGMMGLVVLVMGGAVLMVLLGFKKKANKQS